MIPDAIQQRIRAIWPDAIHIRDAGDCDVCHRPGLYSFQLEHLQPRPRWVSLQSHVVYERCGYWCARCGFSNAGSRRVEDTE